MVITNTDNVADNGTMFLNDVESLTTGVVNGVTMVFAVGGDDDGLSVFELNDDGTLTNLFNISDDSTLDINSLREIQFVEVGGQPMLVAGGNEDAINVFSVANDGTLTLTDEVEDDSSTLLNNIDALTTIEVGGNTFVVVGNSDGNSSGEGVSVYSLDSSGNLTLADQEAHSESSATNLDNVRALVGAESGGNSFVVTGSYGSDGLSVFQVDSSGNLTNVFNIDDGTSPDISGEDMELNGIRAMTTTEIGGRTYIYAGGSQDDGISVFELNNDGSLTNTFNLEDGGVHELDNLRSIEIATGPGGTQFLFAVGDNIDALQIYTVNNDGSLSYFDTFEDNGDTFLDDAEDITWAVVDGKLQVMAGGDENGISVFTIPCFTPGTPILTPDGSRPVESLQIGDRVITDGGVTREVRFVAMRRLSADQLAAAPHLRPIRIRAHAFGPGHPERDILVSPQHRILVSGYQLDLDYGLEAALAPAKGLLQPGRVEVEAAPKGEKGVVYVHIGFAGHEVITSAGLRTESFLPGPEAVRGLDAPLRAELFEIFPALKAENLSDFAPARALLSATEARLLDIAQCHN